LVAFGSTRRPLGKVDDDATLRNLIEAETSSVCIVAKAWDYHVEHALQTTLEEGLAMVGDSVKFLSGHGRRVLDVVIPRLGHDADARGLRVDQVAQRRIVVDLAQGTSGRTECDQR
ncbi:MAG: putative 2-isopropylmalate synthase, partial [Actinomycetota bacterium]